MSKFFLILEGRVDKTDRPCRILGVFINYTPWLSKKILHVLVGNLHFDLLGVDLKILDLIIFSSVKCHYKNISPS